MEMSHDLQVKLNNFGYSDPCNISVRTQCEFYNSLETWNDLIFVQLQVKNVTFARHDWDILSPQANELFRSEIVFENNAEREWLLANVHSTTISIKIDDTSYEINGNYVFCFSNSDSRQFILILHGFDETENWTT